MTFLLQKSPIMLKEPLTNYPDEKLKAWLDQNNIYFPADSTQQQLIHIIHQNSSLGGNEYIFPITPESLLNMPLGQYLSSLPAESVEAFLNFLPLEDIIIFCSTSTEFSDFCKNPSFWKVKSKSITQEDILNIFDKALEYGISPLINALIPRLKELNLSDKEFGSVFRKVIKSDKLNSIKIMLETFGDRLRDIEITFGKFGYQHPDISFDLESSIQRWYESEISSPLHSVTEIIYLFLTLTSNVDTVVSDVITHAAMKEIDYLLDRSLQDNMTRLFNDILADTLNYLMDENLYDKFVKYWDTYGQYLTDTEEIKKSVENSDKYPYHYVKAMGYKVSPEKIEEDMLSTIYDDPELFKKIWNDYNHVLNDEQKDYLFEYYERKREKGNRLPSLTIVQTLIRLAESDDFNGFKSYWFNNVSNMSDDDITDVFENVPPRYQEAIVKIRMEMRR